MAGKHHKNSYEYQRVMEIINDYWLEEPDEEKVTIIMKFKHHTGMEQEKCITWKNPKYKTETTKIPPLMSLKDIMEKPSRCPWCNHRTD